MASKNSRIPIAAVPLGCSDLLRNARLISILAVAACLEPKVAVPIRHGGASHISAVDARPPATQATTTLVVWVTDGDGGPNLPAKLILGTGDDEWLRIGNLDMYDHTAQDIGYCEIAPGVIGTWEGIALIDGTGEIPIGADRCTPSPAVPFGTYRLQVLHGIDYEPFETTLTLEPNQGRVLIRVPLRRAWSHDGALAADLHIHSEPSPDSNVPLPIRVASELVMGMEVLGASDHNYNGDFDDAIDALQLRGRIASVPGNEVSLDLMHANIFPVEIDRSAPDNGALSSLELNALSARALFERLHALPGSPLVQVNHPRLRYAAYFDKAHWDGVSWPPPMPIDFDAFELLHGMYAFNAPGDERVELALRDLYTFMQHGKLACALGNSDTHHLNQVLAGVPRNYVFVRDGRLDPFDMSDFLQAIRQRRVMITTGPWLEVDVAGAGAGQLATPRSGRVPITIAIRQASFVRANRLRIWVGGELRRTIILNDGATRFEWTGQLTVPTTDTWIGVDVTGSVPLPPQLVGHGWDAKGGIVPVAVLNPILVDGNGNGWFDGPAPERVTIPDMPPLPAPLRGRQIDCMPPASF